MITKKQSLLCIITALLSLCSTGCQRRSAGLVKAKVFALSPQNYLDSKVMLLGRVNSLLPAAAGFTLSDDSGKIFVSTEGVSERAFCPDGYDAFLEGSLHNNEKIQRTYFIMSKLIECSPQYLMETKK